MTACRHSSDTTQTAGLRRELPAVSLLSRRGVGGASRLHKLKKYVQFSVKNFHN